MSAAILGAELAGNLAPAFVPWRSAGRAARFSFGFAYFGGQRPAAVFAGEIVRLRLDGYRLVVEACFFYENPWPVAVRQGFSCPTPTGSGLGKAAGITAEITGAEGAALVPLQWFGASPTAK